MTTSCKNCSYLRRVISRQDAEIELLTNTIQDLRRQLRTVEKTDLAGHIPEKTLALMIRLCHPDRHGGSTTSNVVTEWLLRQRDWQTRPGNRK